MNGPSSGLPGLNGSGESERLACPGRGDDDVHAVASGCEFLDHGDLLGCQRWPPVDGGINHFPRHGPGTDRQPRRGGVNHSPFESHQLLRRVPGACVDSGKHFPAVGSQGLGGGVDDLYDIAVAQNRVGMGFEQLDARAMWVRGREGSNHVTAIEG